MHVGLDTFAPVKRIMLKITISILNGAKLIRMLSDQMIKAKDKGRRVIAVGTTSVRTLESAFYKSQEPGKIDRFAAQQIYSSHQVLSFKVVDAMITNFHLPKSTLLMLVSAFAGRENILKCYDYAMGNEFRFYSFGDAMLIL